MKNPSRLIHIPHRGGYCQDPHTLHADSDSLKALDPSLWNTAFGRRRFLKTTGAATAGTAIALNGLVFEVLASQSYLYIDYHKKKVRIASSEEPQPYMVAFSQMNAAIEYFNTYQTDQQSLHNLFTGAPVVMDFGIVPGIFDIPIWNGTVSIEVVAVGQTFEQSTDLFTWEVTATLNKNHYDEFLDEI